MPDAFFDYLAGFTFTGDLWAVPEGTAVFAQEPLVRITAPIGQAQLVETAALALINFQTSVASKAARIVSAAGGRKVFEFGARRAHGLDAALFAARSAYLAGAAGTSFVEAGRRFAIPLSGTMAHSWVMSADSEATAFDDYARLFGGHSICCSTPTTRWPPPAGSPRRDSSRLVCVWTVGSWRRWRRTSVRFWTAPA